MDAPLRAFGGGGLASAASMGRWVRMAKIVALYTLLAPLMASLIIFAGVIIAGLTSERYGVSLDNALRIWWSWIVMSYFVGAPYALVVSAAFASAAVLAGRRQLAITLTIAIAPILLLYLLLALGDPTWRWPILFIAYCIAVIAVPTTVCWLLTRRWHSPSP